MLKLTKTGIGLLAKQYRSVLRKCFLLNLGLFTTTTVLNLTIPNTVEANGVEIGGGSAPHFLAVAIGSSVNVGGDYAIGIGNSIVASARDTIAIGGSANATNTYAVAYGAHAKATGEGSIALGAGSISSQKDVVSVGHLGSDSNCTGLYCGLDYFRRIVNVADGINAHDVVTLGQMNNALNYYYTKTEADARYAKLSGGNIFSGSQLFINESGVVTSVIGYDSDGGNIWVKNTEGKRTISLTNSGNDHDGNLYLNDRNSNKRILLEGNNSGGVIHLSNSSNVEKTTLSDSSFTLNGSAISATGIVANTMQNSTALITSGGVYDALNYYYTFRVDERVEMIDYTSFFQKDFSTLQEVDLHIKNPTHLGAFTKCDEVCPRPSERFSLSLSQEQMLKNDASVDAGTFSICSLQIENVNEKLSNVFEA